MSNTTALQLSGSRSWPDTDEAALILALAHSKENKSGF